MEQRRAGLFLSLENSIKKELDRDAYSIVALAHLAVWACLPRSFA
jgi:hypothetical protein